MKSPWLFDILPKKTKQKLKSSILLSVPLQNKAFQKSQLAAEVSLKMKVGEISNF